MTRIVLALLITLLPGVTWAQNYAGQWWDPAQNGMGLSVGHEGNTVALAWYHYTTDKAPTFMTMSCPLVRSTAGQESCTANLLTSTGPTPMNFVPAQVTTGIVLGIATLTFNSSQSGSFDFNFQGQSGRLNIVPQIFSTAPSTGTRYAGLWWNPDQNGMGYSVGHQGSTVAVAWYHYTPQSRPTFLIFSCALSRDTAGRDTCSGRLLRPKGPLPMNYSAAQVEPNADVGSATISFLSTSLSYLTYSFEGQTGTIALSPFRFSGSAVPRKLMLSIADPTYTGSQPVMVVDLASGIVTSSGISQDVSINCTVGNLTNANLVRIVCGSGANHYDYNPVTNTVTRNLTLPVMPPSILLPVLSTPQGTDFYGTGIHYGKGHILVRNGNAIDGSIETSAPLISHLVADFATGKLFTLNQNSVLGTSGTASIDRIDIASRQREAFVVEDDQGLGMAFHQGELYIIMRRDNSPNDVVKFDAATLQKTGQTSVAGPMPGQTVYALAVDGNGVHIGTQAGITTLSHSLNQVVRTTPLPSGAGYLVASSGKLYVIVNTPSDNVLELDSGTHAILRGWTVRGDPQRPVVIGN